jgi:hypothetical protein
MAGVNGQVHDRFHHQKNRKKKTRAKTRKGGWQALGFESYQKYLLAKKNGELDNQEENPEKE